MSTAEASTERDLTSQVIGRDAASTADSDSLLRVTGLARSFRGLQALSGYNLTLRNREILGVIGPNGAGKTTLFNVLTGFLPPTSGQMSLRGRNISGLGAEKIAALGIARTFQNIRLFGRMSVLDNVLTAQQLRDRAGFWPTLVSARGFRQTERNLERRALEHLDQFGLAGFRDALAPSLPYGLQRKLEIARALATEPSILLLDEPAAGMNPQETVELTETIRDIHSRFGLTLIVVEHDMSLIMRLCERIQVLNYGRIIAEGSPAEVRANPAVIEAYLGTEE